MSDRADRKYQDTRDIAVEANSKVDQHMTDCTQFRINLQNTLIEFRDDIKKLNWRMAMIVGGFTLAAKALDYLLPAVHHAP
jgi:hypothetical protein